MGRSTTKIVDKIVAFARFAQIPPITIATVVPSILGVATAMYISGYSIIEDPHVQWLCIVAGGISVFANYILHILNDLTDYEVDTRAFDVCDGDIGMARSRPLSTGDLTRTETFAGFIVGLVIIIGATAILFPYRPWSPLFVCLGFLSIFGYNLPLKMSHKPFSEVICTFPGLFTATAFLAYVATGSMEMIIPTGLVVAALPGVWGMLVNGAFFSVDAHTDALTGRRSTVLAFPTVYWNTLYAVVALGYSLFVAWYFQSIVVAAFLMPIGGILLLNGHIFDKVRMSVKPHEVNESEYPPISILLGGDTPSSGYAAISRYLSDYLLQDILLVLFGQALMIIYLIHPL